MASRKIAKRSQICLIEGLEHRQLFATVNVTDYGAVASDGGDDSYQVQRAVNASSAGDTIYFPAGTYNFTHALNALPSDRTYLGEVGAILQGRTSTGELFSVKSDNVEFKDLTFDGGGVALDKPGGGYNTNIFFDNDVFQMNTSGDNDSAITFTSGLQNSSITNCLFTGYDGGFGIYGYNYKNLTIANNEFVNVTAGLHIDAQQSDCGQFLVEQNYVSGAKGMGFEFQGSATGVIIQDNWYEHPNLSSTYSQNNNSFAFSVILDKSKNIEVRRNVVIAPERPDGVGCRIAFEVGGDNTVVEDNYINGTNDTIADNDGVGSSSVVAKNNLMFNYLQSPHITFPASNRTFVNINNGSGATLTWNIARGKPGRNHRLSLTGSTPGGTGPTGTISDSDSGSDPSSTGSDGSTSSVDPSNATPTNLAGKIVNGNRVDLTWDDNAVGEIGYYIERSLDDGKTWSVIAQTSFNATSFTNVNLPPSKTISYRIRNYSSFGYSAYSNIFTITTPAPSTGTSGDGSTGTGTGTGTTTQPTGGTGTYVTGPNGPFSGGSSSGSTSPSNPIVSA